MVEVDIKGTKYEVSPGVLLPKRAPAELFLSLLVGGKWHGGIHSEFSFEQRMSDWNTCAKKYGPFITLQGINLSKVRLSGFNLAGFNIVKANLAGANLMGANLDGANLMGANLSRSNLDKADLVAANLKGANLERAYLNKANLQGANLEGANLYLADLGGAKFINVKNCPFSKEELEERGAITD